MQHATTAGELRHAVDSMLALPGMSWPVLTRSESLMLAATEQRELARLHDSDPDTGLANRRRFRRALREMDSSSTGGAGEGARVIVVRLSASADQRTLARAAHACAMSLRSGDLAGRLGHRRLGVLLRESSHPCALLVAARLREVLLARQRPHAGPEPSVLVVSRQHSELFSFTLNATSRATAETTRERSDPPAPSLRDQTSTSASFGAAAS